MTFEKAAFNALINLHNRRCLHDVIGVPYDELLALRAAIDTLRPFVPTDAKN